MSIEGIREFGTNTCSIFYIDQLSNEFKSIIRTQLQGIYNGFSEVEDLPEYFSYQNTLLSFWDRYVDKAEDTKKGMIGELLSHIILNHSNNNLTSLSILKNKEERSIKKGFDIIYCNLDNDKLWYSEVKSGSSSAETATDYNIELLDRAKNGILEMISQNRNSRWESALFDVSATIKQNEGRLDLRTLLSNDSPIQNPNQTKNAILISVLYFDLAEEIELESVEQYFEVINSEDDFLDVIIVSIQKSTYDAVADFLQSEMNTP